MFSPLNPAKLPAVGNILQSKTHNVLNLNQAGAYDSKTGVRGRVMREYNSYLSELLCCGG